MTKPRVLIDGLVFENRSQIGIWRLFYEVISRLSKEVEFTLWLRAKPVQPVPERIRVITDHGRDLERLRPLPYRLRKHILQTRPAPRTMLSSKEIIFHSTYFTTPPQGTMRSVVTVFDMIAERMYSIAGDWAIANSRAKGDEILAADRIIAISKATASDLKCFYPETTDAIRTILLGADHLHLGDRTATPHSSDENEFALFVGHRDSYKNFRTVLEALCQPSWPRSIVLHVVGSDLQEHEWRLINALGLAERVVQRGRLSDEELQNEYLRAKCFLFPSLMEGFGLPLIEAQINRCPVLCSDIPVFREIVGESACYFDPRLGESIADCVSSVCETSSSDQLIKQGLENARRFTWDQTAAETLSVYRELSCSTC